MANNPFDPPIVQVKKTMDRGGLGNVNRGFGSTKMSGSVSRPAPVSAQPEWFPTTLAEMDDVDTETVPPEDGQALVWDADQVLWIPGDVASGGGGGGTSITGLWDLGWPSSGSTGQSQAMKGAVVRMQVASQVTSVAHEVVSSVTGRTYRLGVYRLNEGRTQIAEVVAEADYVAQSGDTVLAADLSADLDAGFWYLFACRDTTGSNLPSRYGAGQNWPGIGLGQVSGGRGTAVPAVGASVDATVSDTYSTRVGFKIGSSGGGGGGSSFDEGTLDNGFRVPGFTLDGSVTFWATGNNNTISYDPMFLVQPVEVTAMMTEVYSSGSGQHRVGIYSADADWIPGSLVYESEEISTSSTGRKIFTPVSPISLSPGRYLLATNQSSSSAQLRLWNGPSPWLSSTGTGSDNSIRGIERVTSTYGSLPAIGPMWSSTTAGSQLRHTVLVRTVPGSGGDDGGGGGGGGGGGTGWVVNLARLLNITWSVDNTSFDSDPVGLSVVFDGNKAASNYVALGTGVKDVYFDLGAEGSLDLLRLYMYPDSRVYRQVGLSVSNDLITWDTVFAPQDVSFGTILHIEAPVPPGTWRYIRIHSEGSTNNNNNEYIELEIFGKL